MKGRGSAAAALGRGCSTTLPLGTVEIRGYRFANASASASVHTALDALNAQERKHLARRDLAQAHYDCLMARIRLQALAGSDKLKMLTEINAWLREAQ